MYRTKCIKLLLLFIFITLTTSGCDKSSEDIIKIVSDDHAMVKEHSEFKVENALNEGLINLRAGNIQKSIEILEKFITYYPTNSLGHYYLGKAYFENNELNKSLHHTKQALYDKTLTNELAGPIIGKGVLGRVFVTNEVIEEKNLALKPKACFDKNTPVIYASLEIINAPSDSEIEAEWVYELPKNEQVKVNSSLFKANGSKNALVSVKKPTSEWPAGKYRLNVYINGEKNTDLTFYVF
ncbi:MAG: hypothetical protein A2Y25_00310 [Candidatus Melainabacteria bacterium GWF2_37_15]|nr:MAG: hypothetical protein A2Y25_00310 [Candidatus Melainabacteria bacterium GWF2_37_15]